MATNPESSTTLRRPVAPVRSPTLAAIARELNLTPRAVSQALNGGNSTVKVSEKTRQRVLATARKMHYRPNLMARALRTGKSDLVGVIARHNVLEIYQRMLYAAQQEVFRHGLTPSLSVVATRDEAGAIERSIQQMLDTRVNGVLVVGNSLPHEALDILGRAHIPVVGVCTSQPSAAANFLANEHDGFRCLTEHVIDCGARRILIGGLNADLVRSGHPNPHWKAAFNGTQAAVAAANTNGTAVVLEYRHIELEFEGLNVSSVPHLHGIFAPGYRLMQTLIEQDAVPDALIGINDSWAYGAMLACAEAGIRIPQEMLLTGFDDDPLSSAGLLPLTTVRQPVEKLMTEALNHLVGLSQSDKRPTPLTRKLPCELIIRTSTTGKMGEVSVKSAAAGLS